jgi:predicted component of type VI protein secretion system
LDNCLTEDDANMQEITGKIRDFFNRYESRVNRALDETPDFDAKETDEAFCDFFIAANPNGGVASQKE